MDKYRGTHCTTEWPFCIYLYFRQPNWQLQLHWIPVIILYFAYEAWHSHIYVRKLLHLTYLPILCHYHNMASGISQKKAIVLITINRIAFVLVVTCKHSSTRLNCWIKSIQHFNDPTMPNWPWVIVIRKEKKYCKASKESHSS